MVAQDNYLKKFYVRDYLYITLGLALYAFGLMGFIKPAGVVTGGLTGIALIVEYGTKGAIPLQATYFTVNVLLLIVALKILGIKFLAKTIYGVVVLTLLISFAPDIITRPIIADEPFIAAIVGGMMCGAGIGLVFSSNGSTGGTDIVVAIINKYRNIAFGRGMLLCDFIIICSSYLVIPDANKLIHGLLVMGVMTYTIDMVINGFRQSVQVFIISPKYETIADAINSEMHRGCTVLDGMGWYSKTPTKVLLVLAKRSESMQMFRLIKTIDEHAFISQSVVRGVYGLGFDQLRGK